MAELRFIEVTDAASFGRIPPCADPRFDHRTCDYWEDADRGSKASRRDWLRGDGPRREPVRQALEDNPFAPPPAEKAWNPFAGGEEPELFGLPAENPFAPPPRSERPLTSGGPRKLGLLDRGRAVFGSYAKLLLVDAEAVAYAQFGPLSAYPRAARLRDLYPQLPAAPLPAVITCIASTAAGRRKGYAVALVREVCRDLTGRGFSAVEAYPDLTRSEDETSGARPAFWEVAGFVTAVPDERFPVMRRELD